MIAYTTTLPPLISTLYLRVILRNEGEGGPDHANKGAHPPRVSVVVGGGFCQAGAEQGSRGVCLSLSAGNAGLSTRPDRSPSVPPSLLFTCKGHRVGGRGRRGPDQPPELVGNTAPVSVGPRLWPIILSGRTHPSRHDRSWPGQGRQTQANRRPLLPPFQTQVSAERPPHPGRCASN